MNIHFATKREAPVRQSVLKKSLLAGVSALFAFTPLVHAEVVKIGFIEVMSGPFANAGMSSLNQLREVVSQLNAKSGSTDHKFEVVPFDGKGSPQESTNALKAAVDQGIRYVTQGGGSGVAFALSDAISKLADREPAKAIVFLNSAAMDPLPL